MSDTDATTGPKDKRASKALVELGNAGAALLSARLYRLFGIRRGGRFGVLMYHRVCEEIPGQPAPTWNVTPRQLRAQLEGLRQRGFEPWPLGRLIAAHQASQPIPSNAFAVTFDDGYENNYLDAWPLLRELRVPATIFLATKYLDSQQAFPFDDWSAAGSPRVPQSSWRPLSSDQCREMLSTGLIDLGAHTHTHQKFAGQRKLFETDLRLCLEALKDRFGIRNPALAFPYGEYTIPMADAARQAGVCGMLSTKIESVEPGASERIPWGRYSVDAGTSAEVLASMLAGWYTRVLNARRSIVRPFKLATRFSSGRSHQDFSMADLA